MRRDVMLITSLYTEIANRACQINQLSSTLSLDYVVEASKEGDLDGKLKELEAKSRVNGSVMKQHAENISKLLAEVERVNK